MNARNLINDTIPPLKLTDNGQKALNWMNELHVYHLPVVNENQYIGMVAEYDILDANDSQIPFKNYENPLARQFVSEDSHIYEVLKTVNEQRISVMPVLDEDDNYIGVITLENLLDYFANANSMQDPGGIIILEMSTNDYALSEIAQILESNDTKALSMYVSTYTDSTQMEVTLKVNRTDLQPVIATFERYDYTIKASYQEDLYIEDLKEHFDSLMHYLNI